MDELQHPGDFSDDTHPNDKGFFKMARIWWIAIENAYKAGFIKAAPQFTGITSSTCEKVAGRGTYVGTSFLTHRMKH